MKVRDIISQLRELLNNVNTDQRFTNQFLHHSILSVAKLIIKREADNRRLFNSIEAFQEINCLKLEATTPSACGFFIPGCKKIMKSINKIPEAYQSSNGYVMMVYDVFKTVQFYPTTPSAYSTKTKREFKAPINYYWIVDDYLYIPDSSVAVVSIIGLFVNTSLVDDLNGSKSCKFMDSRAGIPDWLREDILRTTLQNIAGVTKRIPEDANTNLNPNQ